MRDLRLRRCVILRVPPHRSDAGGTAEESSRQWEDVNFRDRLLFYEYFDGDTGRGLGASHQTGWTALVAKLLMPRKHESTTGD